MDWTALRPCLDLLAAALLGGIVGAQRQAARKPAGFRTHLLVALGSCAFTLVGAHLGDTRIAANVLTGIGFLGAGAIVRSGFSARGLTTAASIWTVAAIGLAIGFQSIESYIVAIGATIITFFALGSSDAALMRFFRFRRRVTLGITYALPEGDEDAIVAAIHAGAVAVEGNGGTTITGIGPGEVVERGFKVDLQRDGSVTEYVRSIASLPGVTRVAVDEAFQNK
jgi:putative Mg2+ transporter-C (MgtC) family protein